MSGKQQASNPARNTRSQSAARETSVESYEGNDITAHAEATAQRVLEDYKQESNAQFDRLEAMLQQLLGQQATRSIPQRADTEPDSRRPGTLAATPEPPTTTAKPKYLVEEIGYFDPDGYTATQRDATTTFAEYDVGRFIEAIEAAAQYQHEAIIRLNLPQNLLGTAKEWYLYKLDDVKRSALREGPGTTAWCSALRE